MMFKLSCLACIASLLAQFQLASAKSIYGNLTSDDVAYVYSGQFKIMLQPLESIVHSYEYLIGNLTDTIDECNSVPTDFNTTLENIVANSTAYLNNLPSVFDNLRENLIEDKDNLLQETSDESMVANASLGRWLFYNHWCFTIFYSEASANLTNTDFAVDELLSYDGSCSNSNSNGDTTEAQISTIEGESTTTSEISSTEDTTSEQTSSSSTTRSGKTATETSSYTIGLKRLLQKRDVDDDDFGDWAMSSLETVASPIITLIENYEELVEDIIKVLNEKGTLTDDDLTALSNVITYTEDIINNVVPTAATYLGDALIYDNNITVNYQTMILANFTTLKANSVSQLATYLTYYTDDGSFSTAYTTLLAEITTTTSTSTTTSSSSTASSSSASSTYTSSTTSTITSTIASGSSTVTKSSAPFSAVNTKSSRIASSSSSSLNSAVTGASSNGQLTSSSSTLHSWVVSNTSLTSTSNSLSTTITGSTSAYSPSGVNTQKVTQTSSTGNANVASSSSSVKTMGYIASTITGSEGKSGQNEITTTVITVTTCSDHVCSKVPVTTGLSSYTSNVNGVLTVYTTFCPLTGTHTSTNASSGSGSDSSSTVSASEIKQLNSPNGVSGESQKFSNGAVSRNSSAEASEKTLQTSSQATAAAANPSLGVSTYEEKAATLQHGTGLLLFIFAAALL